MVLIILGLIFNNENSQPQVQTSPTPIINAPELIYVQIRGEVYYPDIYQMDANSRLYHLIDIAGGFTQFADYESLNMVEKLSDGIVVHIAKKTNSNIQNINLTNNKISINYATESELMKLTGIGESRAKSIVEYRMMNGPYRQLSDLLKIPGISESIFNNIIHDICL